MSEETYGKLITALNDSIEPIRINSIFFNNLMDQIGNSRFVLIGEATHGTHEFYQTRINITKQLIKEKGFMAVAIEGDFPDAYQIHRYIQGKDKKDNWQVALEEFKRFPTWMWRNNTIVPFIKWLRNYNDKIRNQNNKIGFYGLDLYSLNSSMDAVMNYLSNVDRDAYEAAKLRYACFNHLKLDPQEYGYLTNIGIKEPCFKETMNQFMELQKKTHELIEKDSKHDIDENFYAIQNARVIKNAEEYYRSMYQGHIISWNLRDHHMAEMLDVISSYLEQKFNKPAKVIVWAHNSHIGDARASEFSERGEYNIGQLVRERFFDTTYLIGFSTYKGFVTAADDWDMPALRKKINPAVKGSYEELFHNLKIKNFILNFRNNEKINHYLSIPHLQRAIGVIYLPESELDSHYFLTHLPSQFDSIIHFDETSAVEPLELNPEWK